MSASPFVHAYVRTYTRPSVRPQKVFDFNEIWQEGTGRWVMHDGMQYELIQGQGQGHEPLKVGNPSIFSAIYNGAGNWPLILKLGINI